VTFGVYVHIPFCTRRCDYCAFATWTDRHHLTDRYIRACRTEIERADAPPASSVFIGGGTPSLVPAPLLAALLGDIEREPSAEVTVECNPETVTPLLVDTLLAAGVTRLSFGVQSMVPHVLRGLGRLHRPEEAVRAASLAAEAGVPTWNVDLIFGGFGERDADWRFTLDRVLALDPPHVSAYALTVEAGTPLAADLTRHPDDDVLADRYLVAEAVLTEAARSSYEISNWARPGHECRHNLLYWDQGDYRGIGCAAHSHQRGTRWWNVRTPERYIEAIESGCPPVGGAEVLDEQARAREALELSLRTRAGVPVVAVADLDALVEGGMVAVGGGRAALTPRGRLVANEVAMRLTVAAEPAAVGRGE
jgi:putative oxygen-independent coproporphyrinogen III oxidase